MLRRHKSTHAQEIPSIAVVVEYCKRYGKTQASDSSFQVVQRIESVVLPYFPTHCMVEEQMSRLSWSSFVAETMTLA